MKSPSHPGRLIKADLDELGLSVMEAAKALGISRQQLARKIEMTPDQVTAQRQSFAYGNTHIENDRVTREMVAAQLLSATKEAAGENTGGSAPLTLH